MRLTSQKFGPRVPAAAPPLANGQILYGAVELGNI